MFTVSNDNTKTTSRSGIFTVNLERAQPVNPVFLKTLE